MKTTLLHVNHIDDCERDIAAAKFDREKIIQGVKLILEGINENADRDGLIDTPKRVADMYMELFSELNSKPADEINYIFTENTDELILVKEIQFSSICEHHLVPFIGVAHVGYIPNDGVVTGLSKLARVVESTARRLQVQERMTVQIADALVSKLNPKGVIVVVEAEHLCMSIRGVKKPGSKTVTSAVRGVLKISDSARAEAYALLQRS